MENNKTPFFSIVIPTKNRPGLLKDAIQSALWQNFSDFEVLVSDNFNDQETQDVIASFKGQANFRSIRTSEELKMIDHWEFATQHARGEYVIILADRKVLYQNALKKIAKTIKKYPHINAFSFGVQMYNEHTNRMGWNNAIGSTKVYQTTELIENFLKENLFSTKSLDIYFPKTLNGCYKNSFAKKVRTITGRYFNNVGVTTPDYSSFFINCTLNKEVVYIGEKLILTQGEQTSNGRIFGSGNFNAYMNSLGLTDVYEDVMIKAPLIYNLLVVDLLKVKKYFGGNLSSVNINLHNYFSTNYYEIVSKKNQGMTAEVELFFTEKWSEAINLNQAKLTFSANEIKTEIEQDFDKTNQSIKWDKFKRFNYHLQDYLALRYSEKSLINSIYTFKFRDIFHAAGFKK